MSDSPPPEESRGKALSPVSPKPILFPSPSNVPILEKQMEPAFEASAASGALLGSNAADANRLARQQLPGAVQNGFKAQVDNESSERTEHTSTENHQIISSNLLSQPTQPSGVSPGDATAVSEAASSVINPSIEPPLNASVAEPKNDPAPIGFSETNQPNPAPDPTAPAHDSNAGGVDFQTLLAQLSHTPVNPLQTEGAQNAAPPAALLEGAQTSPSSSIPTAFLGNPNLPPRPPPQEKPATHPNYNPADDIRSYHPHSQQNLAASYRAQNSPQTLNTNAPGMSPPVPPFQQTPNSAQPPAHSPITPSYRQRDAFEPRPDSAGTQTQWSPEVEQIYAQFLRDESANVAEGRWERFPPGSRLFVGNLPTEKVNKRDLFERFYRYGTLAQISIKQAFGFVQFLDEDACHRALNGEQGVTVAGRKMHLEISKPQRNTNKGNNRDGGRRRSRSPDYNRGGRRSIDRYSSSGHGDSRDQNFRRGRDDYRPRRDRDRGRSPDDYYTTGEPVPRRPLSSEPVNSDNHSANLLLQLPLRTGAAVPDVQIIYDPRDLGSHRYVISPAGQPKIKWRLTVHSSFPASVQKMMERVGLTANILTIDAPGIEDALVSRCVMEGVIAITKPTFDMWAAFDISFKIYSRNGTNVRFDGTPPLFSLPDTC